MDTRLHTWFIAGAAMAVGAFLGRYMPHLLFCCLVMGSIVLALLGILKTLKRWDG